MVLEAYKGCPFFTEKDAPGSGSFFAVLDAHPFAVPVLPNYSHQLEKKLMRNIFPRHLAPYYVFRQGPNGPCRIIIDETFFGEPITIYTHEISYLDGRKFIDHRERENHVRGQYYQTEILMPWGDLHQARSSIDVKGTLKTGDIARLHVAFVNP